MKKINWNIVVKRRRRRSNYTKKSKKKLAVRDLYAPGLVGRYDYVVRLPYFLTQDEERHIRDLLYDLIPRRYKITTLKNWKATARTKGNYSIITNVYLKSEEDLLTARLAFQEKMWRVYKVVGTPKPRKSELTVWQNQRLMLLNSLTRLIMIVASN